MTGHAPGSYEPGPVLARAARPAGAIFLCLFLVLGAAGPAEARAPRNVEFPDILVSAAELLEHVPADPAADPADGEPRAGWRVLDARPVERYEWGHIPGAIRFDPETWNGDASALSRRFGMAGFGISPLDTVVCYSDRESPAAAGELFWILELAGHPAVKVLNGGFEAWTTARGAIETERPAPPFRPFTAAPDTTRIADFDYVLGHFGRPGFTVLDWRAPEEWAKGHIPHSLPFPLETLVGEDGLWLSGEEMRKLFAAWGPRDREYVDLNDEFIVLGGDTYGHLPIHPYLAARLAGIRNVRVYPAGFSRWMLKENAPITRLINVGTLRDHFRRERGKDFRTIDLPPADFILLDLRGVRDWQNGHIPGAIQVSPTRLDDQIEDLVAAYWPGADRTKVPVVVYCYGSGCTRSRWGTTIAARHGFTHLEWFKDGVEGWRQVGEKLLESR